MSTFIKFLITSVLFMIIQDGNGGIVNPKMFRELSPFLKQIVMEKIIHDKSSQLASLRENPEEYRKARAESPFEPSKRKLEISLVEAKANLDKLQMQVSQI
ncbi:hypothetical protein ILUMI_00274 [Ignelater luminosus]|uniref:Uncharacterized protein n=1 Tax=Ignelater luminosus TaxID=2038154 RepID=A0A8K0DKS3_IGNLU|nr:hypothetical protein ILUMI_00274 [Ignelater luminosus]